MTLFIGSRGFLQQKVSMTCLSHAMWSVKMDHICFYQDVELTFYDHFKCSFCLYIQIVKIIFFAI